MPSTATTNLRLELQNPGENPDTWGTKNNTNIQLLEDAVSKRVSIALSSVDVTLTANQFAGDQSRSLCLNFTGVLTGNVNVIVPSLSHMYLAQNQCTGGFSVTVKTLAGTGAIASAGSTSAMYCDGTNVVALGSEPFYETTAAELAAVATVVRSKYEPGDVRRYCTAAETNHQIAFATAHASSAVIYAPDSAANTPGGFWNVDYFEMNIAGRKLRTDGFATKIKQRTGNINRRIIEVTASNVIVEDVWVEGNIAVDTGEQQHGVLVLSTSGTIRNIKVGAVYGKDLRGDAVLVGCNSPNFVREVTVGNVYGENIYRNVVSVIGGAQISLGDIDGSAAGLYTFDAETNTAILQGLSVGKIRGRTVGILGTGPTTNFIDQVSIDSMDLDPAFMPDSVPPYGGVTVTGQTGLVLRNVKTVTINSLRCRNFDDHAIDTIFNVGELGCQYLKIGRFDVALCSQVEAVVNAYVRCENVRMFTVDGLLADVTGTSKAVFTGGAPSIMYLKNVLVTLATGCNLAKNFIGPLLVENFDVTGGIMLSNTGDNFTSVKNGTFDGERLLSNIDFATLENVTSDASVAQFTSGQDHHRLVNCTLDGDHYSLGSYITDYTAPIRFGSRYLWVNPTGNIVYIKNGLPTANNDGTIVGTQT